MYKFSKYVLADHSEQVNSKNEKAKVDDSLFKKLVGDVITQIKADYRQHSVKKYEWYYVFTLEQVEYIADKLHQSGIEIIHKKYEDGYKVRLKTNKE